MKRSEIIETIWEYIQEIETDYDIYMRKENCDGLLTRLENKGMKPPSYVKKFTEDGTEYIVFNKWEPEDETK